MTPESHLNTKKANEKHSCYIILLLMSFTQYKDVKLSLLSKISITMKEKVKPNLPHLSRAA